jgi:hypothetical protein
MTDDEQDRTLAAYKVAGAVIEKLLKSWIGEGRPLPGSVLPEEHLTDGTRRGRIFRPREILRMVIAQEIVAAENAKAAPP